MSGHINSVSAGGRQAASPALTPCSHIVGEGESVEGGRGWVGRDEEEEGDEEEQEVE